MRRSKTYNLPKDTCNEFIKPLPVEAKAAIRLVKVVPISAPTFIEYARSISTTPIPHRGVNVDRVIDDDCTKIVTPVPLEGSVSEIDSHKFLLKI